MKKAEEVSLSAATDAVKKIDGIHNALEDIFYGAQSKGLITVANRKMWLEASYQQKLDFLNNLMQSNAEIYENSAELTKLSNYHNEFYRVKGETYKTGLQQANQSVKSTVLKARLFTGALYVLSAASLAYSAISLYKKINDYYHPKYDVVPEAMVDLIRTVDGDRYIKYDVVREVTKKDGVYPAADLNAFEDERWNALYYTKSYEAGKPLLAEFVLSQSRNRAEDGYLAVHRFGEVVCYDLNKYSFSSDADNVFLCVAQSENQKSAVADVPEVVGSVFGVGFWFLAGGVGLVAGIGATVGTQSIIKRKKRKQSKIENVTSE